MTHFQSFSSHEEMMEHIRRNQEAALAGLHPAQADLTFGSHWVQFYDVKAKHLIFGKVIDEDADEESAQTRERLADGLMFGRAYDRYYTDGEWGYTHKANAWPIEDRLFDAARDAKWDYEALPFDMGLLLNIAYVTWRSHRRSLM